MKFLVKSPCADCPFRASCHPFLRRAYAIARELRDDTRWFACHETTGVKHGRRVKPEDQSHCAGAALVLLNERRPNVAMRLADSFNVMPLRKWNRKARVFASLDEFAKHHEGVK